MTPPRLRIFMLSLHGLVRGRGPELEREETARYMQILYHLQFRPLAAALA